MKNEPAIVLFSGGQDSTTCLFWAKETFKHVTALNIDYGQRHQIEIGAARDIAKIAKVPLIEFKTDILSQIGDSILVKPPTETQSDTTQQHPNKLARDLPASFVPTRNILFLTMTAAIAFKRGITNIVIGVCQTDYSGYPDCRNSAINATAITLSLGLDTDVTIYKPLMYLTKAETVALAVDLDLKYWARSKYYRSENKCGPWHALAFSHTCYENQFPPCNKCPACKLRAKGFKEAKMKDPLVRRAHNKDL